MYNSNFAVKSDNLGYRVIKGKGGFIGVGFDARMAGSNSEEEAKRYLDSCLEDWKMRHPKVTPSEIRYEIRSRVDLIVGGRSYAGYLYFKP